MNPRLAHFVNIFVQDGWTVTSQTEFSASLEKKASSRVLAILLGIIAIIIFFNNILVGAICIGMTLLLIALNNVTKKSGTTNISVLQDGTVQVSSNIKKLNNVYPPTFQGKIKR